MKSLALVGILTLAFATLTVGCTYQYQNIPEAPPVIAAPERPFVYIIQPGDQLDIKFFYNPELNDSVTVRPDGKISLQLVDEIQAAGRTPAQLDDFLTENYSKELRKPVITVIVKSFASQRVYVGGEVNRQGFVNLAAGMSPLQAVIEAGGLKETGDPGAVLLIRKGPENQPVPVRVDLKGTLDGSGTQSGIQLQPQDVVYVPKTFIAEANKFVKQYIEDLFLFRGVSLGFSYELNRDTVSISR